MVNQIYTPYYIDGERIKNAYFIVRGKSLNADTGAMQNSDTRVDPLSYLRPRQCQAMAKGAPDMVLQFAHFLSEKASREGLTDISVTAHFKTAYNGREPQHRFATDYNLATEARTLFHADWIAPQTEPLPVSY